MYAPPNGDCPARGSGPSRAGFRARRHGPQRPNPRTRSSGTSPIPRRALQAGNRGTLEQEVQFRIGRTREVRGSRRDHERFTNSVGRSPPGAGLGELRGWTLKGPPSAERSDTPSPASTDRAEQASLVHGLEMSQEWRAAPPVPSAMTKQDREVAELLRMALRILEGGGS